MEYEKGKKDLAEIKMRPKTVSTKTAGIRVLLDIY
jgi:hypothetical protein